MERPHLAGHAVMDLPLKHSTLLTFGSRNTVPASLEGEERLSCNVPKRPLREKTHECHARVRLIRALRFPEVHKLFPHTHIRSSHQEGSGNKDSCKTQTVSDG